MTGIYKELLPGTIVKIVNKGNVVAPDIFQSSTGKNVTAWHYPDNSPAEQYWIPLNETAIVIKENDDSLSAIDHKRYCVVLYKEKLYSISKERIEIYKQ